MQQKTAVWGPLATGVFFFLIYAALGLSQTFAMFFSAGEDMMAEDMSEEMGFEHLMNSGSVTAWSLGIGSIVCILLVLVVIKLKSGSVIKEYLALHAISLKDTLKWLGFGLLFMIFVQLAFSVIPSYFGYTADMGGDAGAEYSSTDSLIFFYLAVVVLTPLFEEVLFRGFLFKGLLPTFLGENGTIIVTALVFAMIHMQYDALLMMNVFSVGLFFGYARAKSGSLFAPLAVHVMFNLLATVQSAFM